MGDSTGLVKSANVVVRGLQPGTDELRYSGATNRQTVSDALTLRVPIAAARDIAIRKISD